MKQSCVVEDMTISIGLVSVLLGSMGLLLFFMPILCIPLGIAGLVSGFCGVVPSLFNQGRYVQWPCVGIVLSTVVVAIGLALYQPFL